MTKTFLKWPGNKSSVIETIMAALPKDSETSGYQCLIEPFVGSASVFMHTDYKFNILSDANRDLIELYTTLVTYNTEFVTDCKAIFEYGNHADCYYDLRQEFNTTTDAYRKSTIFVYLNKHGFNGLCRYNLKGGYNVPFGKYDKPYFPALEMLQFVQKCNECQVVFKCRDFTEAFMDAQIGDVLYADPPYIPASDSSNFTAYSSGPFTDDHHRQMDGLAHEAHTRRAVVVISNSETARTRQIYANAKNFQPYLANRSIAANGGKRGKVGEVLITY